MCIESCFSYSSDHSFLIKIKGFSCIEPKKIKIVKTSKLFQILFGRQMRRYAVIKLAMSKDNILPKVWTLTK